MKYLIIGNSAAGVNAADAIRKNDKIGSITILSDEEFPAYGRTLISYYLEGKVKAENMPYRDENFYKSRDIKVALNASVKSIDADRKEAVLSDGEKYSYDKLLLKK